MAREAEKQRRSVREDFARFYEAPSRESFRDLLKNHLGEMSVIDFKEAWPEGAKLARHVLAFGNSGGGVMVVGVRELDDKSLDACGVLALVDKADVSKSMKRYLPERLSAEVEILDFAYEASEYAALVGKRFQVMAVDSDLRHVPFVSLSDGEGIRANAVYVRRSAASEEATHDELQTLLNRRIETGYSSRAELDLAAHLEQLALLYSHIQREERRVVLPYQSAVIRMALEISGQREEIVRNPNYPKESFDQFIARMIEKKKRVIERSLAVVDE